MPAELVTQAERTSRRVHSVERTFELLEAIAELGGTTGLGHLAKRRELPLSTTHRLVRTLVDLGYLHQQPSRHYSLGPRLMSLGEHASKLFAGSAHPHLRELVDRTGESANLAILDGDHIVYTAQVAGRHAMRMCTEVGKTAPAYCTAAGKAILAQLPLEQALAALPPAPVHAPTANAITSTDTMRRELERIRSQGSALDDEEREIGVRCVAVAVPDRRPSTALSISGPSPRVTDMLIHRALPVLRRTAAVLGTLAG